jgi:hypothetical protein
VAEHGDAHVRQAYKSPDGFQPGAWCNARRQQLRKSELSDARIAALDALGFDWEPMRNAT